MRYLVRRLCAAGERRNTKLDLTRIHVTIADAERGAFADGEIDPGADLSGEINLLPLEHALRLDVGLRRRRRHRSRRRCLAWKAFASSALNYALAAYSKK